MSDLTKQTQAQQARNAVVKDRAQELMRRATTNRDGLVSALAGRVDPDQFLRALATELRNVPHLDECAPETVLGGMFTAGQMGLEIGGHLKRAYLVPYKRKGGGYEASLIIGYHGYVELFYRAGARTVGVDLIREGDLFRIGSNAQVGRYYEWQQADPASVKPVTGVLSQVTLANGGIVWDYLPRAEIDRRATGSSFWRSWPDEMMRKTGLRHLTKTARLSTDLAHAAAVDETVLRQVPGEDRIVPAHLPLQRPQSAVEAPGAAPGAEQRPKPHPPRSAPPAPAPEAEYGEAEYDQPSEEDWAEIDAENYAAGQDAQR